MTKIVKMSLAAAVAVAGLTSTASADMMMDKTSFSGKLYTEHYYKGGETSGTDNPTTSGWEIDFDVTAESKISDTLTATVTAEADRDKGDQDTVAAPSLELSDAFFTYANKGASVMMGRQAINTPNTDGELAEGFMSTYTTGSITAAAAYFPTNEISASDVTAFAVLGSAGMLKFEGWQVNIAGKGTSTTENDGGSSNTTLVVGGTFGGVTVEARNASTSYNKDSSTALSVKDGNTMKISASAKVSNIALTGVYLSTDKDGAALVTDNSSANTVELAQLGGKGLSDATIIAVIGSMPVSEKGSVKVSYGMATYMNTAYTTTTKEDEASELVFQYNHKFAKSTTASFRYSSLGTDTFDSSGTAYDKVNTHTRIDVTYKF